MEKYGMEVTSLPISELVEFPGNVRIHTKRNLDSLKRSLEEFGQVKNIVVQRGTNYVVAGNGLVQAARALGWTELSCHVMELSEERARALCVLDNRSGDLSQMDEQNLLDFLKGFDSDTLDLAGYSSEELDRMLDFQDGTLFEEKPKKEKKPKKEEPVSSDDQMSFVLMGYPFVLADPDEIRDFRRLVGKFGEADVETRCELTFEMFDAMKAVLAKACPGDASAE